MEPNTTLSFLVYGSKTGAFTGRKIGDYINSQSIDFFHARHCLNGLDKTSRIAALASQCQARL